MKKSDVTKQSYEFFWVVFVSFVESLRHYRWTVFLFYSVAVIKHSDPKLLRRERKSVSGIHFQASPSPREVGIGVQGGAQAGTMDEGCSLLLFGSLSFHTQPGHTYIGLVPLTMLGALLH